MFRSAHARSLLTLAAGLFAISPLLLAQTREIPRLAVPQAQAATGGSPTIYCSFTATGPSQGPVIGDNPAPGQPNSIPVSALSMGTARPLNASGLASGTAQLQPLTIVKAVDRASPWFFQAVIEARRLAAVDCYFYRQPGGQTAHRYFRIRLENAAVIDTRIDAGSDGDARARESLTFWYETITLEDLASGTTAQASRKPT